jgi:hypothetical protein
VKEVKREKKEEEEEDFRFSMRKIEPVPSFYKKNIKFEFKIQDDKERVKRKFGEICVEKRGEEKKENKKKTKR